MQVWKKNTNRRVGNIKADEMEDAMEYLKKDNSKNSARVIRPYGLVCALSVHARPYSNLCEPLLQAGALRIMVTFSFYADADTSSDEEEEANIDWEAISAGGANENVELLRDAGEPNAKRIRLDNVEMGPCDGRADENP